MNSERIFRNILLFFIVAIAWKQLVASGIFKTYKHDGSGFSITYPTGWKKEERKIDKETRVVIFETPDKDPLTSQPEASITVIAHKLTQSMWIEDEFGGIIDSLRQKRFVINNTGVVKIDSQDAGWVLYEDVKNQEVNLEFYVVTEFNIFYKIQYSSNPRKFNVYRDTFEKAKSTLKFGNSAYF